VRRAAGLTLLVVLLTGCTTTVRGIASPEQTEVAGTQAHAAEPEARLPGGAAPSCAQLVADGCDDGEDGGDSAGGTERVSLICHPLPAAMESFDAVAGAAFPGGRVSPTGSAASMRSVAAVVGRVVDRCGFRVMLDVANQYNEPLFSTLADSAVLALGSLALEPDGMRCADLAALGYGAKDAVDYWFLWGAPPLMDADADGIPCETVFPDVERYLPAYY
jgi:hypothetical protein